MYDFPKFAWMVSSAKGLWQSKCFMPVQLVIFEWNKIPAQLAYPYQVILIEFNLCIKLKISKKYYACVTL